MRVTTNSMFNSLLANLNKNVDNYQKINEQAATEMRINRPSDDANGLANSTIMKSQQNSYTQYLKNVTEAKNYLKGADSALNQLQDLIIKIREFAQTNATETSTPIEMDIAAAQIDQFIEEAVNIANTKVNNRYIFAGFQNDNAAYDNTARILQPYASTNNTYSGIVKSNGQYTGSDNKSYMIKFVKDGHVGDSGDSNTTMYQISDDNGETWSSTKELTNLKIDIRNSDGSLSGIDLTFQDKEFKSGDLFMVQVGFGNYQGDNGSIAFNTNFNSKIKTNINGQEIFEDSGFFDSVYKLKNALLARNYSEISETVKELDDLHTGIQSKVALTGINLNRAEVTESNLTSLSENVLENIQSIEKVNIIDILSKFSQAESALNSSITALSNVFPNSLMKMLS